MTDFRRVLYSELERRCSQNPRYSLRAFARDLELSAPRLSGVLNGKFGLSRAAATKIASLLGYSKTETKTFCDLVEAKHARSKTGRTLAQKRISQNEKHYKDIEQDTFKLVADWYHFAIMELSLLEGYQADPKWIAKQLKLSVHQTRSAVERLKRLGLLSETSIKTGNYFVSAGGAPSEAIKKHHAQILDKAKSALFCQSVEERDFSNMTFAIDECDLPVARKMIADFRESLDKVLTDRKNKNSVYTVAVQFFKLNEKEKK